MHYYDLLLDDLFHKKDPNTKKKTWFKTNASVHVKLLLRPLYRWKEDSCCVLNMSNFGYICKKKKKKNQGEWLTPILCNNINALNHVTKTNGLNFTRIIETKLYTLKMAWDIIIKHKKHKSFAAGELNLL